MRQISLTKGAYATVDDADFEALSKYSWCFSNTGYAVRGTMKGGESRIYLMHREILGAKPDEEIDHVDGNRLNNQRSNLRLCSSAENKHNRGKSKNNTSGYKGVHWNKQNGKWRSRIMVNRRVYHLGFFENSEDAAKAYDIAALKYHKDFARVNLLA